MSEDIKKIGQIFKEKRNEMNLSIKEVENATSIQSSNLEAIERGDVAKFLSSVYAIGFMKQYANFLGLDGEKILHDHPDVFRLPAENHEFDYGIGTLEVRGSHGGGVKWFPNLIWIAASALALFFAYLFAKRMGVL